MKATINKVWVRRTDVASRTEGGKWKNTVCARKRGGCWEDPDGFVNSRSLGFCSGVSLAFLTGNGGERNVVSIQARSTPPKTYFAIYFADEAVIWSGSNGPRCPSAILVC